MTLPYDVSRCASLSCPLRQDCQRYNDRPNAAVPYADLTPDNHAMICMFYIPEKVDK